MGEGKVNILSFLCISFEHFLVLCLCCISLTDFSLKTAKAKRGGMAQSCKLPFCWQINFRWGEEGQFESFRLV